MRLRLVAWNEESENCEISLVSLSSVPLLSSEVHPFLGTTRRARSPLQNLQTTFPLGHNYSFLPLWPSSAIYLYFLSCWKAKPFEDSFRPFAMLPVGFHDSHHDSLVCFKAVLVRNFFIRETTKCINLSYYRNSNC